MEKRITEAKDIPEELVNFGFYDRIDEAKEHIRKMVNDYNFYSQQEDEVINSREKILSSLALTVVASICWMLCMDGTKVEKITFTHIGEEIIVEYSE